MDINEAIAYINDPKRNGSRFGLESIARLLDKMGNPHKQLQFIHVAGTNGKGSTSAMMASILRQCHYRVGLFTSPYIRRFNDRIQWNGEDIPDEAVVAITQSMQEASETIEREGKLPPTTFELVTAMALAYFAEKGTDIVVLEVGLGGTLDCTNVIDSPLAAVITPISYDHMDVLGHDLTSIAANKAGIIKPGTVCITGNQAEEAMVVLKDRCKTLHVPLVSTDFSRQREISATAEKTVFTWQRDEQIYRYELPLVGHYQLENAALALIALEELDHREILTLQDEGISRGLEQVAWPGRLEVLSEHPYVVLDGSHNPQGVDNLVHNLDIFPHRQCYLVMGVMADKEVTPMLQTLAPFVTEVLATAAPLPRSMTAKELGERWQQIGVPVTVWENPYDAVKAACQKATEEDLILVAGSLYLVAEVRKSLVTSQNAEGLDD